MTKLFLHSSKREKQEGAVFVLVLGALVIALIITVGVAKRSTMDESLVRTMALNLESRLALETALELEASRINTYNMSYVQNGVDFANQLAFYQMYAANAVGSYGVAHQWKYQLAGNLLMEFMEIYVPSSVAPGVQVSHNFHPRQSRLLPTLDSIEHEFDYVVNVRKGDEASQLRAIRTQPVVFKILSDGSVTFVPIPWVRMEIGQRIEPQ